MKRIGLTGGIGSGKSTVRKIFAQLGVPCYDSDSRAREIMNLDPELKNQLKSIFGDEIYSTTGELDRKLLASKVFGDNDLRHRLEAAVHPAVGRDWDRWCQQQACQGVPYVILESAILFESGFDQRVDITITVSAPEEIRIQRCIERDKCDRESVCKRLAAQMTDAQREARADYVIENIDLESLRKDVERLNKLLTDAAER